MGLLLTSLISLHQLKADKKKMSFVSVFRNLLPTSPYTLLEKDLWMSWPNKAMLRGKILRLICKMHRRTKKSKNDFPATSRIQRCRSSHRKAFCSELGQYDANDTSYLFSCNRPSQCQVGWVKRTSWGNVTGTSDQSSDAISTQINLIKKVLLKAKTIGILYTQSEPNSVV